MKYALIRSI